MNFAKKYLADLEKQKKSMVKTAKKQIEQRKLLEKRVEDAKKKQETHSNAEESSMTPIDDYVDAE